MHEVGLSPDGGGDRRQRQSRLDTPPQKTGLRPDRRAAGRWIQAWPLGRQRADAARAGSGGKKPAGSQTAASRFSLILRAGTAKEKGPCPEARPKFREETPRRRTADRRATADAALQYMTFRAAQINPKRALSCSIPPQFDGLRSPFKGRHFCIAQMRVWTIRRQIHGGGMLRADPVTARHGPRVMRHLVRAGPATRPCRPEPALRDDSRPDDGRNRRRC